MSVQYGVNHLHCWLGFDLCACPELYSVWTRGNGLDSGPDYLGLGTSSSRPAKWSLTTSFNIFCGNDRAFAEPHAAEKAVFQHKLVVDRSCDVTRDQNNQQDCKSCMDLKGWKQREVLRQWRAIGLKRTANEPPGEPSAGDHQEHNHIQTGVRNRSQTVEGTRAGRRRCRASAPCTDDDA